MDILILVSVFQYFKIALDIFSEERYVSKKEKNKNGEIMVKTKKNKEKQEPTENLPETIVFRYEKSPNYSVYAINGAHGGFSPKGDILMNVFYERHSIPETVTHKIENGLLGPVIDKEGKEEIIREIFFGLSMPYQTAVSLRDWFIKIVKHIDEKKKKDLEPIDWESGK